MKTLILSLSLVVAALSAAATEDSLANPMPLIANTSFNGGEISPLLYHRLELEKRSSAVARCENFLPLPYGGVRKRPGTRHITQITNATANSRMFAFRGSDQERYIIVINASTAHFYRISTGLTHSITLGWPLTENDLPTLRWVILNDVITFCHANCHPFEIRYEGINLWRSQIVKFTNIPENNTNLDDDLNLIPVLNTTANIWIIKSYIVGEIVRREVFDGRTEYVCTVAHTAAAGNEPGVGAYWRYFWAINRVNINQSVILRPYRWSALNWSSGQNYPQNTYLSTTITIAGQNRTRFFRCLKTHISSNANRPGAENGQFWRQLPIDIFDFNHAPSSTNPVFQPGAIFTLTTERDPRESRVTLTAETASNGDFTTPIVLSGTFTFNTFGTWAGIFVIQKSLDGGTTWDDVASYESVLDRNFNESLEEEYSALYRLGFVSNAETGSGTGRRRGYLAPSSPYIRTRYLVTGVFDIGFEGTREAEATALDIGIVKPTTRWTENAFNRNNGYPSAITIFQRRLIYAATRTNPLDIWMSRIEDFGSFRADTKDDDPIHVTLAPSSQNRILWLAGQRRLHIGCQTGEWVVGSQTNDAPITPLNFQATEVTTYGSSETTMPLLIGDATVYLQRHDQRIREMGFIADRETYDSADLTRLAEHILTPNLRITRMAWQESREPTLWCVVSDGTLRTLTYIRQEKVFAWARHRTQAGSVVNVTVSPTQADDDEVYWLVNRSGSFMLELLPPNAQQLNEAGVTNGTANSAAFPAVYDSQYTGPAIGGALPAQARWGGLGAYTPAGDAATATNIRTVAAGANPITGVTNYVAGIPVVASLVTLPLEAGMENGTSLTRYKQATKLYACLFLGRNLECAEYRPNAEGETVPPFATMRPSREAITRYAAYQTTTAPAPALTAGWVEANVNLSSQNLCAELRHAAPTPCTITALVWDAQISP